MKGRVDYLVEGWCTHCGDKHKYAGCKFLAGYYRCPDCGRQLRMKPKYNKENRQRTHPYIPKGNYQCFLNDIKKEREEAKARLV